MTNVLVEQKGPLTIITINREAKRNAVDADTAANLGSEQILSLELGLLWNLTQILPPE